jgi:hypothetical protein
VRGSKRRHFVMAGLDPAIHVFLRFDKLRRGSPGQAR